MHHPETLLRLAESTRHDRLAAAERHRARRAARRSVAPATTHPDPLMCEEPRRA